MSVAKAFGKIGCLGVLFVRHALFLQAASIVSVFSPSSWRASHRLRFCRFLVFSLPQKNPQHFDWKIPHLTHSLSTGNDHTRY